MIAKENKLKKNKDFKKVFEKAKNFKNNLLVLRVARNNSEKNRFGFIVSSKVSKKAVIRNRIRRRLLAIIKNQLPSIKEGFDIILIALPSVAAKDFSATERAAEDILKIGGLIKK